MFYLRHRNEHLVSPPIASRHPAPYHRALVARSSVGFPLRIGVNGDYQLLVAYGIGGNFLDCQPASGTYRFQRRSSPPDFAGLAPVTRGVAWSIASYTHQPLWCGFVYRRQPVGEWLNVLCSVGIGDRPQYRSIALDIKTLCDRIWILSAIQHSNHIRCALL